MMIAVGGSYGEWMWIDGAGDSCRKGGDVDLRRGEWPSIMTDSSLGAPAILMLAN